MTIQWVKKMGYLACKTFILCMLCPTMPVWAEVMVDDFVGQASYVEQGQTKSLVKGEPLPNGAQIKGEQGSFVRLVCKSQVIGLSNNGQPLPNEWEVNVNEHFPYTVNESSCSLFGRVKEYWRTKVLGTSGPNDTCISSVLPVSIPMLPKGKDVKLFVVAESNTNSFYLGWRGGKANYKIEVFDIVNGQEEHVASASLGEKTGNGDCVVLKEKLIVLDKGKSFVVNHQYKVKITDGWNKEAKGTFKVVAVPRTSLLDEAKISKRCEKESEPEICLASWIAFQSEGKWAFDVYQQVAKNTKAEQVRLSIAEGKKIWK
ncbi:MAG: hypothetical protein BWK78_01910 [Thiotrichaceae bacterium IS1]|nr:MAG: hypothetical protein BWK78_01910 [Thiotrichaceae bacterium IS1]